MQKFSGSAALFALMMATAPSAYAQTAEPIRRFDIGAGPLERALPAFAAQSRQQILYPAALAEGRRTPGVTGSFTAEAALTRLLQGSGLEFRRTAPSVFVVYDPSSQAAVDPTQETTVIEEVVVTGTLLRGAATGPSPVISADRSELDRDGRATVAQHLAALPQNFGGTANEGAIGNGGDRSGTNGSFANGVNLRGLGSDATLVLINGRRIAGAGAKGDFADISSVPVAVVDRIDVLLDGASALYGADAVGGVVNIILKKDYEGAETRIRLGDTWDGASSDYQFGQILGGRWIGGGGLVAYEYSDREALAASERPLAGDADLRPRGGSDRRLFYSNPGNIVAFNPASGGFEPAFGIPSGQNGQGLRASDFLRGTVNLENHRAGVNVLPRQTRQSVYAAAHQELGPVELSGDVRYGLRRYETVSFPITTLLTVTQANPYFASPTGARSHTIAYSFQRELPAPTISGEVETFAATLGAAADLPGGWRLDSYLAYSEEETSAATDGALQSTFLREALGSVADNPATPFNAARDGYLNPFGDGAVNPGAVLDFLSSGFSRSRGRTTVTSANLLLDGVLIELPGGPLRVAAGASLREETFERRSTTFTSGLVPTEGQAPETTRDVAAVFIEARVPLIGPGNTRPGLERLELSVAARFEDYGDVGQTTSPKVGVVWEPNQELRLRANYGRSFRAPALRELNDAASASPSILPRASQQILSMILYGGNPDLTPEEADTWTAGFEYRPQAAPGARFGVNVFRTDFDNRIGQPALENILSALSDPALAPFVRTVDPLTNADDRAAVQAILDLPSTNLRDAFPATSYGAIVDARYVNTARVQVEGIDFTGEYGFDIGPHAFDIRANIALLERYDARATPTSDAVSQLDRPNYPVGLRGRVSGTWRSGDWALTPSIDHVGSYEDLAGEPIGSWTTMDLQVRFAPETGALAGTSIALTLQNVFDREPPFYDAPEAVAYDAANANVLGRFISLQITKSW